MSHDSNRRDFIGKMVTAVGAVGAVAAASNGAGDSADTGPDDLINERGMPCGKIGNLPLSRVILGTNIMGGWAHARDLSYVGPLMRAYNTEEKIFETLALAESVGINTMSQGSIPLRQQYNRERGGKMKQICPLGIKVGDGDQVVRDRVKRLVDQGAAAIYIFGHDGDLLVRAGEIDIIGKAMHWIRDEGVPAGVGGHSLYVVTECEEKQVAPDFYFKTFHSDRYWSATLPEFREEYCWYMGRSSEAGRYHDNMWCIDPDKLIEVMRNVKAAWLAFKVLAAGALPPRSAFSYAFRHGADFIIVGILDFQIEPNAQLAKDILSRLRDRDRPWRA